MKLMKSTSIHYQLAVIKTVKKDDQVIDFYLTLAQLTSLIMFLWSISLFVNRIGYETVMLWLDLKEVLSSPAFVMAGIVLKSVAWGVGL